MDFNVKDTKLSEQSSRLVVDDFASIYDKYSPKFFGMMVRLVPRKEEHDTLFQKSFSRIQSTIATFDPAKQSLFSWMFSIVLNVILEWHESQDNNRLFQDNASRIQENDRN